MFEKKVLTNTYCFNKYVLLQFIHVFLKPDSNALCGNLFCKSKNIGVSGMNVVNDEYTCKAANRSVLTGTSCGENKVSFLISHKKN